MKRTTNIEVQIIRGVLCLFVVFYHWTLRYSEIYSYGISETLQIVASNAVFIGMCGFCIISGFYAVNPNKKPDSMISVFVKRIIRLYPGYLISLFVIFCFTSIINTPDVSRKVSVSDLFLNIPFLHLLFHRNWVDGAHWYVVFSIITCSFIGVFRYFENLYDNRTIWYVLIISLAGGVIATKYVATKAQLYIFYVFLMYVGAYIRKNGMKWDLIFLLILTFVCGGFCKSLVSSVVLIFTLCYIASALTSNRLCSANDRSAKALCFLGDRSYNVFLVHQNIGYAIIYSCMAHSISYLPGCIIALIVVLLLASAIHFIDTSIQTRLTRIFEKRKTW